jgi:hypothetical protein
MLTIPGFSCNLLAVACGDIGFIGLESRPQSAFVAFSKSNERVKVNICFIYRLLLQQPRDESFRRTLLSYARSVE